MCEHGLVFSFPYDTPGLSIWGRSVNGLSDNNLGLRE